MDISKHILVGFYSGRGEIIFGRHFVSFKTLKFIFISIKYLYYMQELAFFKVK